MHQQATSGRAIPGGTVYLCAIFRAVTDTLQVSATLLSQGMHLCHKRQKTFYVFLVLNLFLLSLFLVLERNHLARRVFSKFSKAQNYCILYSVICSMLYNKKTKNTFLVLGRQRLLKSPRLEIDVTYYADSKIKCQFFQLKITDDQGLLVTNKSYKILFILQNAIFAKGSLECRVFREKIFEEFPQDLDSTK